MIICHPLRLIFFKSKKVGGTSFEIALSRYCGADCVITPISKADEILRRRLGFRGAQNHDELDRVGVSVIGHPNEAIRGDFRNHDSSAKVHDQIGDKTFHEYLKISIRRNPLDFLISQYFFRIRALGEKEVPFDRWYFQNRENVSENERIAPNSGPHACDIILRYETLAREIAALDALPGDFLETFSALDAKGNYRDPDSLDARRFFTEHGLENEIEQLLSGNGQAAD